MADQRQFIAKTVADALTEACVTFGVTSDRIDYEVTERGSDGFLGLGKKPAVIRAWIKEEAPAEPPKPRSAPIPAPEPAEESPVAVEEPAPAPAPSEKKEEVPAEPEKPQSSYDYEEVQEVARDYLSRVIAAMGVEAELSSTMEEATRTICIEMKGKHMGVLIGKRGQTLDALQYLTKLAVGNRFDSSFKVKVDTEDYRSRRKKALESLAYNTAMRVRRTGRKVELEPMNPFERRIIHFALQDNEYVTTHSEGEEPDRYVVVVPK